MEGLSIYFFVILLGLVLEVVTYFFLEKILGRPFRFQRKYKIGRHVSLISIPILGFLALLVTKQFNYAQMFVLGSLVGTMAEYAFGRFVHKIEGKRIWVYQEGVFSGYTSLFSIPYWGGASLLFVQLAKLIGA